MLQKLHLNYLDCVFSVRTPCSLGAVYHPVREKQSLSSAVQSYFEMCNQLFRLYGVTFLDIH
jgi:hypothetical protein